MRAISLCCLLMGMALFMAMLSACSSQPVSPPGTAQGQEPNGQEPNGQEGHKKAALMNAEESDLQIATFAGGCFWCIEAAIEPLDGVQRVVSGFTGGTLEHPSYKQVASGHTKHVEAVQVHYDPQAISYEELLEVFWRQIDPTDAHGQFADRGYQYSTAVFYHNQEQRKAAEASKKKLEASGKFNKPIVTRIEAVKPFYPAEDYHQDYYKKNSAHYKVYHHRSGRGPFINQVWGKEAN